MQSMRLGDEDTSSSYATGNLSLASCVEDPLLGSPHKSTGFFVRGGPSDTPQQMQPTFLAGSIDRANPVPSVPQSAQAQHLPDPTSLAEQHAPDTLRFHSSARSLYGPGGAGLGLKHGQKAPGGAEQHTAQLHRQRQGPIDSAMHGRGLMRPSARPHAPWLGAAASIAGPGSGGSMDAAPSTSQGTLPSGRCWSWPLSIALSPMHAGSSASCEAYLWSISHVPS